MRYCKCCQCSDCAIIGNPALAFLVAQKKEELCSLFFCTKFQKKQILALEGNSAQNIFIAKKGKFKSYKMLSNSKQQIIKLYNEGDILNLSSLYQPIYVSSLEAMTEAETCTINKLEFESFLEKNPLIATGLIKSLTQELSVAHQAITDLGQKDARSRVAGYLISSVNVMAHQNKIVKTQIDVSRTDMANILGITQETLIRILQKLKGQGVIDIQEKEIFIKNITKLINISR